MSHVQLPLTYRTILAFIKKSFPVSIPEIAASTKYSVEEINIALAHLTHLQLITLADPSLPGDIYVQPNGRSLLDDSSLRVLDFIHSRRKATRLSEIVLQFPLIDLDQATHIVLDLLSRQFISLKPQSDSLDLEVMSSPHPALSRRG